MAAKSIVILIVCSIVVQVAVSHPSKRHVNTDEINKTDERICENSTPCGWAVYQKLTRTVEYFMKNKCSCSADKQCVRDEEDISVSAFVYRCKIKTS